MTAALSRAQFEHALRVVNEGRPLHSLYAVEDAKHALKPVSRYYWRQNTLMTLFILWPAFFAPILLPNWPWFASYFAGGLAGTLLYAIVIQFTPVRRLMAPPGLSPGDVVKAAHVLLA